MTTTGKLSTTVDWTVLDLNGIPEIAHRAARKVATEYAGLVDLDDQRQDALILLATNPILVREHIEAGALGRLHRWIWCRLIDKARPIARRANQTISYERRAREVAA
ncbi:hypothetical protein [Mangrovihabitans endophyticus]|uniref:Uncharacterized protein n=1 Tax=Mangrovihabitans endophyticus TaxID=1751298 RepID=A0A8J3C2X9_9ACTN|nr:hypothetical protein [Mangrovihabitans endophyticus]GGL01742.1 hypothetical protein GCM10012284_40420 [Mangrovihabitans endophyticus]